MKTTFLEAIALRRSIYGLSGESPISDAQIQSILETVLKQAPSAFHTQAGRVVWLKADDHKALWNIVLSTLEPLVPAEAFPQTRAKIESFAAGYGTLLYFEEMETVEAMQAKFPLYAQNFPVWAEHESGILQFMMWTALAEAGLGASLQHYNPLIDDAVRARWNLPKSWKHIAQMPFGGIAAPADEKDFLPMEQRLKVFG